MLHKSIKIVAGSLFSWRLFNEFKKKEIITVKEIKNIIQ